MCAVKCCCTRWRTARSTFPPEAPAHHTREPEARPLTAIGASKAEMESAVRFSFSEFTTLEQIDYTLDTLREVLPMLRRFTRK